MPAGKFGTSVKILIFNEKNELLILRRGEWKENPKFSRQPDIPGGKSLTKLFYMLKLDHTPEIKISWEHENFAWRSLDDAAKNVDLSYRIGRSDGLVIPYVHEHREIFGV